MPSGVYPRTKPSVRTKPYVLNSSNFKKGHIVPQEWRDKSAEHNRNNPNKEGPVAMRRRKEILHTARWQKAWELGLGEEYERGHSVTELIKKYRISNYCIKNLLSSKGVQVRTRSEQFKLRPKKPHRLRWVDGSGYIYVIDPGYQETQARYVPEHVLVWERVNNRKVLKGWVVHHLNGIAGDNRPENLVAMSRSEHHDLARPYRARICELEAQIELLLSKISNFHLTEWSRN